MIATRAGVLERVTFFRKFVEHPTEIGSVTPSSAALVEAMADQVPWQHVQSVIELGSGTGTFTRAMGVCQVKCVSFFRYHKRRCVTSDCWL